MKHRDECKCVFCHLHCHECESTNLDVEFKPVFRFSNDTMNQIDIGWADWEIKVECQDCGEVFQHNEYEENFDLEGLACGIANALGIGDLNRVTINDKGEIDTEQYTMTSEYHPAERDAA